MFGTISRPKAAVLGLTLELYSEKFPGYMERLRGQLGRFAEEVLPLADLLEVSLCYTAAHVQELVAAAEKAGADALLLVPLSYTASGMVVPALLETTLPVVIWNTQEAADFTASYGFDDLLMNHVCQGTQDLSSVLLREGRAFGMESGHFQDKAALARLGEWLAAARAVRHVNVGLLGRPFEGMDDFRYDPATLKEKFGVQVKELPLDALLEFKADEGEVSRIVAQDKERYELAPGLDEATHRLSIRLELALRQMVEAENLDAFTMNFLELIKRPGLGTLPFLGVNKLIAEGMGYAGEGDILRAAWMSQARMLAGEANFTEIYTVDYRRDRLMMTHMQECNSALARRDRKVRLVKKDFWAPGVQPYVGMWFTLEPGPVTLSSLSVGPGGELFLLAYEANVEDAPPLEQFDIPHWIVQLDEPVGVFLNRYGMAGGPHHLISMPGRQTSRLKKLATLRKITIKDVQHD